MYSQNLLKWNREFVCTAYSFLLNSLLSRSIFSCPFKFDLKGFNLFTQKNKSVCIRNCFLPIVSLPTGVGNITDTSEFNFYCDPESANIVLTELGCDITMACWELCLKHAFDWVITALIYIAPVFITFPVRFTAKAMVIHSTTTQYYNYCLGLVLTAIKM